MLYTATATQTPKHCRSYGTTPRINGQRLLDSIHTTCDAWGQAHRYGSHPTETGMARLALDDNDARVRRWLIEQVEALGCTVTVDQMGNIFAVRPGRKKESASPENKLAPTYMGSHLDTQATGGRYDGILGVLAGLEALRTLHEHGVETQGPVGLVNWTNEEGARFPLITMASGAWAGVTPLDTAWNCSETAAAAALYGNSESPATVKAELARIGFLGETPCTHTAMPMAAHFELHIEQGPILETEGLKIGVVEGAQGYAWYEVTVRGKDAHAGTTPLHTRRDALLAAAQMIVAGNAVAAEEAASSGGKGVVTTGVVNAEPGTPNTIPHTARFTLDIRHPKAETLAAMVARCRTRFDEIARGSGSSGMGVEVEWTCLSDNAPATFHADCVAAVEAAADEEVGSIPTTKRGDEDKRGWKRMWSGAGHDSCNVNKHYPAGMIFTPTRDGLSHTPTEYCSPEDCVLGAQVLLGAVLRFDAKRLL